MGSCCQPIETSPRLNDINRINTIKFGHYSNVPSIENSPRNMDVSLKKNNSFKLSPSKSIIKRIKHLFINGDYISMAQYLTLLKEIDTDELIDFDFNHEWADSPKSYNTVVCIYFGKIVQTDPNNNQLKYILDEYHDEIIGIIDQEIENEDINFSEHFLIFLFFYLDGDSVSQAPLVLEFIKRIFLLMEKQEKNDFIFLCLDCLKKLSRIASFQPIIINQVIDKVAKLSEFYKNIICTNEYVHDENTQLLYLFRIINFLDEISFMEILENECLIKKRCEKIIWSFYENEIFFFLEKLQDDLKMNIHKSELWEFRENLQKYLSYLLNEIQKIIG